MSTPYSEGQENYGIPALVDFGHEPASLPEERFPGGEQEALRRLEEHMKRTVLEQD